MRRLVLVTKSTTVAIETLEHQFLGKILGVLKSFAIEVEGEGEYSNVNAKELGIRVILRYLTQIFLPDPPNGLLNHWDTPLLARSVLTNDLKRIIGEIMVEPEYTLHEFLHTDAQVAIDPSILGKVIEVTQSGAERETKGVFFTPRIEIEFMCKIALLQFITRQTHVPVEKVTTMLFPGFPNGSGGISNPIRDTLLENEAEAIEGTLCDIRILDPACGTGAFILGMLHELVQLHGALAEYFDRPKNLAEIKANIILQNLFGLDVNQNAIQVTQIRLAISLLCEQEEGKDASPIGNLNQVLAAQFQVADTIAEVQNLFAEEFDIVIGNPPYVQHTRIAPPQVLHPTKAQKMS